jgi:hypothetical protein
MTENSQTWLVQYFQGPRGKGHNETGFDVLNAGYPSYKSPELDGEMDSAMDT